MRYRYRNNDELKDSGVEWIGKIPKDWEVGKFKYSSLLYTGNSIKDNEKDKYTDSENSYPYISTKDINIDYNTINYSNGMYTKTNDRVFKIANKDSILICIEGGSAGRKISYLNQNVSFVNKLCCIQSSKINSKFQYYYCNTGSFKREFSLNISGLIGGVSVTDLNNFRLVNPSLLEQEKIANFLDENTSQFDLIISKKEILIERLEEAKKSLISEVVTGKVKVVKTNDGYELVKRSSQEMKDSGVEWIGEIPKDWQIKKAKYISEVFVPQRNKPEFNCINEGVPWITTEDLGIEYISINNNTYFVNKEAQIKVGSKILESDSVITTCVGTFGISSINKQPVIINQQLQAFTKLKVNKNYLNYFLRLVGPYFESIATETTIKYVNREKFENLKITYPIEDEQQLIVNYLRYELFRIDNSINKIKLQIEKLKEAKQSLISEAVTGKIEIL